MVLPCLVLLSKVNNKKVQTISHGSLSNPLPSASVMLLCNNTHHFLSTANQQSTPSRTPHEAQNLKQQEINSDITKAHALAKELIGGLASRIRNGMLQWSVPVKEGISFFSVW